jgi:hypothetical protein
MAPRKQRNSKKGNTTTDEVVDHNNDQQLMTTENQKKKKTAVITKTKSPPLRGQLSVLTLPVLKNILRFNHQNPFGNKPDLLSRIVYLTKNGCYPSCPKCLTGRLKARLHRRKDQSKYYCPGYPLSFRAPASYHRCDYVTDECNKETFHFPPVYNITI